MIEDHLFRSHIQAIFLRFASLLLRVCIMDFIGSSKITTLCTYNSHFWTFSTTTSYSNQMTIILKNSVTTTYIYIFIRLFFNMRLFFFISFVLGNVSRLIFPQPKVIHHLDSGCCTGFFFSFWKSSNQWHSKLDNWVFTMDRKEKTTSSIVRLPTVTINASYINTCKRRLMPDGEVHPNELKYFFFQIIFKEFPIMASQVLKRSNCSWWDTLIESYTSHSPLIAFSCIAISQHFRLPAHSILDEAKWFVIVWAKRNVKLIHDLRLEIF